MDRTYIEHDVMYSTHASFLSAAILSAALLCQYILFWKELPL